MLQMRPSLGVWKQGRWQTKLKKKNIQGESPESFLVAGRLGTVNRPSPVPVRPLQPVILSSHWSGTHSPTSPALLQPGFAFQQRESWGLM